jgi:hypothetical protein
VTLTLVTGPGERTYWLQYAAKDAAARQRALAGLTESRVVVSRHDRGRPCRREAVERAHGALSARRLRRAREVVAAAAVAREAQLRLMNGVYGGGAEPEPGQPVKVVN